MLVHCANWEILGNIYRDKGLKADPENIDTILMFPTAGYKTQLQTFLGMANYLKQFCRQLCSVIAPLWELQVATEHWKWTPLHDIWFEDGKAIITSNKMLKPIDAETIQSILLHCYASDTGIAGWNGHKREDGNFRHARFVSTKFCILQKTIESTKKNYFPSSIVSDTSEVSYYDILSLFWLPTCLWQDFWNLCRPTLC